jgi:hypothetical protein
VCLGRGVRRFAGRGSRREEGTVGAWAGGTGECAELTNVSKFSSSFMQHKTVQEVALDLLRGGIYILLPSFTVRSSGGLRESGLKFEDNRIVVEPLDQKSLGKCLGPFRTVARQRRNVEGRI